MGKALALLFLGFGLFLHAGFVAVANGQSAASTRAQKKKALPKTIPLKNSSGRKTSPAGRRLVRTKSGRLARISVHVPPAPTFQTHPDPDRYIEIQKALTDRGYFKGESNGEWGDDSVDALRRFQQSANLPDDGKISALTLSGLGLGPRHDGSSASTVPLPQTAATPSVAGSTVGPAVSAPAPATSTPPPVS